MKKIFFNLFLLLLPQVITAQGLREQVAQKVKVVTPKPQPLVKTKKVSKPIKEETDTIYCLSTKRQHGWIDGLDIVSKEDAKHNFRYFMLTNRNAGGHWTKMEVLNGYGHYVEGQGESPYILSIRNGDTDVNANKDWVKRLKTVCQYEYIEDPIMGTFVQERAYDKNRTLVYTFSRMNIGNNKYLGTYKDAYGFPAEMRVDSAYTYGTLAVITEDIWGNDSIIEFVDPKGKPKDNNDGVGMEVRVGDKYGHILKQMSCDHDGNLVIDNWGNCGVEHTYDMKTHRKMTQMTMDINWQPMPTPFLREDDGIRGCVKVKYFYDKYGRDTAIYVITPQGEPAVNDYGTHRFVREYDNYGNRLLSVGYDLKGNLSPLDGSGIALYKMEYDDLGRDISGESFDKDRNPLSNPDRLSRYKCVYGNDGLFDEKVFWIIKDGVEDTCYYYKRTNSSYYERWGDGTYMIDSLDAKGRKILTAYYNADGKPMVDTSEGYHCKRTVYSSEEGSSTTFIYYFDSELNTVGAWIGITDSLTARQTVFGNNQSYIMQYDDSLKTLIADYDCNSFGNICRAGGLNGDCRLYSIDINRSQKGNSNFFTARDEFGEPDYMVADNGVIYYYAKTNKNGYVIPFDEHSNPIESYSTFKNKCHKAISVEVTDSTAYKLGLLDNDVILKYGSYIMLTDTLSYRQFLTDWTLKGILDAKKEKDMVVFRVNPETKEYGLHIIENLMGTPSELGFIPHVRYLTTRQYDRILKTVESHEATAKKSVISLNEMNKHKKENAYKDIVISFPEAFVNTRNMSYMTTVKDPALLLGVKTSKGDAYLYGQNPAKYSAVLNSFNKGEDKIEYVLATNMEGVKSYTLEEKFAGANWLSVQISSSDYKKFRKLAEEVEKGFNMRSTKESNDSICPVPLIVSRVELDGLARSAGLEGDFAVFEYNEWNMERGLDGIGDVITKGKEMKKHLIFAPIFLDNAGYIDHFGEPVEYNLDEGMLGMRIFDMSVMQSQYNEALNIYKKYKKKHKNKK